MTKERQGRDIEYESTPLKNLFG